jgi:hypothetical protein
MTPTGVALIVSFLGVLVSSVVSFVAFDSLVRLMFASHRDAWRAARQPRGHFWAPSEPGLVGSVWARDWLSFRLVFKTPPWVSSDTEARRSLRRFRQARITTYAFLVIFAGLYLTLR